MKVKISEFFVKDNWKKILAILLLLMAGLSILPSQESFAAKSIQEARATMRGKVLRSSLSQCKDQLPKGQSVVLGANPFEGRYLGSLFGATPKASAPLWLIKEADAGVLDSFNYHGEVSCYHLLEMYKKETNKEMIGDILKYGGNNCGSSYCSVEWSAGVLQDFNNASAPGYISDGEWYLSDLDAFTNVCSPSLTDKAERPVVRKMQNMGTGDVVQNAIYRTRLSDASKDPVVISNKEANYEVRPTNNESSGLNNCEKYANNLKNNIQTFINFLNSQGIAMTEKNPDEVSKGVEAATGENGKNEKTCMNAGGAGALAWMVCPALEWAGNASNFLYESFIEPALRVEPRLFADEKGQPTGIQNGWKTFRDIANVFFIVLLMAVIFSQLTGVGIDNYGIKKVLPKLIVAAVMINLSFWICTALVDISNIVGNAFQGLFDGLGNGLNPSVAINNTENNQPVPVNVTGAYFSAAILYGIAGVGTILATVAVNPALLLTLGVSALGVIISMFFLFVLLSAREAAIVVLTVISPIAVVCYMLPNTKTLFDKWWKFFKGLLLVYPIAGLLVGGGNYVAKLLLSVQGTSTVGSGAKETFFTFTAMIAGIVPVFFIPTVLKSAFAAMGNIGSKLAGLGTMASKGAQGKIRNTEGYKNAQKAGLERKNRIKAGLDKDGNETRRGAIRRRLASTRAGKAIGLDRSLANKRAGSRKIMDEKDQAAQAMMQDELKQYLMNNPDKNEKSFFEDKLAKAGNKTGEINTILGAAAKSGMKKADVDSIARKKVKSIASSKSLTDDQKKAMLKEIGEKNDFSSNLVLQTYLQAGGTSNGGTDVVELNDEWIDKNIDMQDVSEEVFKQQSTDSAAELAIHGKISEGVTRGVAVSDIAEDKKMIAIAAAEGKIDVSENGKDDENINKLKKVAQAAVSNRRIEDNGNGVMNGTVSEWKINQYLKPNP